MQGFRYTKDMERLAKGRIVASERRLSYKLLMRSRIIKKAGPR
jgi:hypothetical protein